ncbi:NAD-dependent epimerase/dehydratase family protein [Hyphococcus sp.]|uniref:NAD-dependent epimerase/dehydratase family protein n=1 Tax=Hyphococcus sp. TaxID=2038636 RepID=UPI003CCBB39F
MTGMTLVTGGAGFVGQSLVAMLRNQGERVRSLDIAEPAHEDDIQGSITDEESAGRAMDGVTTVFHLAGNAQLWAKDPSVFEQINHGGTKCILNAALQAGVERLVHCSSLTTLVGKTTPVGESYADESVMLSPDDMLGPYPRSKCLAEREVEIACQNGLDAVIALPTEPLGPGDDSLTPPTRMILDFANGATPAYIDCVLNFVPVDSLAEGLIAARGKGRRAGRYLLGGANVPMAQLLAMIEKFTGRAGPKTKMPYWVALAAGMLDTKLVSAFTGKPPKAPLTGVRLAGRQVSFSSEKAAQELGWRAAPVEPSLKAMLDWAREKQLLKPV